jgi:hypothetical protein
MGLVEELLATNAHADSGIAEDDRSTNHPPLDVVSNMFPSLSMTDMCVVLWNAASAARDGHGVNAEIRLAASGDQNARLHPRIEGQRVPGDEHA